MLKKRAFFIACLYTITLSILSLIKLNELEGIGPSYKDKIFHFLAYGLFTLLWYNALRQLKIKYALIIAATAAIICGIILEILQGRLTTFRDSNLMDALANTMGVLIMTFIILFKSKRSVKKI